MKEKMKEQGKRHEEEGTMNLTSGTIFIISGDLILAHQCIEELAAFGGNSRTMLVGTVEQAREKIGRSAPAVVFLDESAIDIAHGGETLESAVALLTETAPVVVAGAPEKQAALVFLITSGAVDFVARTGHFLPIVAGMLDRRARMAARAAGMVQFPKDELSGDFGEILRHEVNNPLTGILGNTELLLARRDRLPPAAIERLETIAGLAVRLRETVRRLSNAWDEHHEHAGHV
jgi:signal transduction histidine kinase